MKLIMCNEKELDSLMNRKEIFTSNFQLTISHVEVPGRYQ